MARVSYDEITDADLLSRAREDPEGFGVFYDRHEAALLAFFWRATHRGDLAAEQRGGARSSVLRGAATARNHPGIPPGVDDLDSRRP